MTLGDTDTTRQRRQLAETAIAHATRGDWEAAVDANRQLLETGPDTDAYNRLGKALAELGRNDEAIELYEAVIGDRFDSSGPYDRLIAIYSGRAQHADVMRVCDAAVVQVHTYQDKKDWYRTMRAQAEKAKASVPAAAPRPKKE